MWTGYWPLESKLEIDRIQEIAMLAKRVGQQLYVTPLVLSSSLVQIVDDHTGVNTNF